MIYVEPRLEFVTGASSRSFMRHKAKRLLQSRL
ncbi:hypothetical protein TBK1r_71740 [Stieleria magnilauensis]|uniref:Uncharacterized protein n=1 Tax=Stieleria magnilauensis TaxID=2527963 RepID=A0ABX5Y302_9BACT|nr:hypothetical protein TBK1r_71740 [Planctomycetes bacterium TBK1r]